MEGKTWMKLISMTLIERDQFEKHYILHNSTYITFSRR